MLEESAAQEVRTVQRQIDAYNRRDLNDFLSCYAESVQLLANGVVSASGKQALRAVYAEQFAEVRVQATSVGRIHHGEWVVDAERIVADGAPAMDVLALYRVRDGLIDQVQFLGGEVAR
ncbi:nuclear transport factor 2 family protein [Streptomyces sp. NPDC048737]|uniref:nuclear transport factor 2 family protein n=1 Tax=unclassified Streptomyces TaxID=2593676 RepID=UPI0034355C98